MSDPTVASEVAALRRELKLTWDAHEREHTQHELAHSREHGFAQDAISKAAEMAKENKTDANEWRASMNDREAKFATKSDVATVLDRLDKIERLGLVSAERERLEKEEASSRVARSQWTIGVLAGVGAVLVNLVLRLWAS